MNPSWTYLVWPYLDKVGTIPDEAIPSSDTWFKALSLTPPENTKVVIVGEKPYSSGIADGMAFSCGQYKPAHSLRNIYREINTSGAGKIPHIVRVGQGNLEGWAKQGVLLLNSSLTVKEQKAWKPFTDGVLERLNEFSGCIVFMLWGATAKRKSKIITNPRHKVLQAALPSRSSAHRGFFGCNHFNLANEALKNAGKSVVDWANIGEEL